MLDLPRIEIGSWIESIVDWLTKHGDFIFDRVKDSLTWLYENLSSLLLAPDPLIFAIIVGIIAWRVRGIAFGVFSLAGLVLINNLELWEESIDTLALVLIAAAIAIVLAVPWGILATRSKMVSTVTKPILDLMQTMPAFVWLIPAVALFRIGAVPGLVATVVFSMPPAVRLTELGIRQVDEEIVEAGQAFGASPRRILLSVQLPLAKPTIMAGINQVIMLALSMVVIAGIVGAGGLGGVIFGAVSRVQIGAGFEAGLAVVIIAVILDRFTSAFASSDTPRARAKLKRKRKHNAAQSDAADSAQLATTDA